MDYLAPVAEGLLITIEGIDGAGKTTLAGALRGALSERGLEAQLVREPGGVALAERLRALLAEPGLDVAPHAEALLFAAARAQLVQELLVPLLGEGSVVLMDRFADSSLAYQGAGRGLGEAAVQAVNDFGTGGLRADRTLLLRADPDVLAARQAERGESPDRLEQSGEGFFATVARGYDALVQAEPQRVRVVDAAGAPGDVLAAALAEVQDLLP